MVCFAGEHDDDVGALWRVLNQNSASAEKEQG
jgi:hypothetical protein